MLFYFHLLLKGMSHQHPILNVFHRILQSCVSNVPLFSHQHHMVGTSRWRDCRHHSHFPHSVLLAGVFIALSHSELSLGRTVSFLREGFRVRAEPDPQMLCCESPGPAAWLRSDYQTQTCWWETLGSSLVPVNSGDTEVTPETWHRNSCGWMLEEEERAHSSWGW